MILLMNGNQWCKLLISMYDDKGVSCGVCSGRLFLILKYRCRPLNSIVKEMFFAVKLPIKSKEIHGNTTS